METKKAYKNEWDISKTRAWEEFYNFKCLTLKKKKSDLQ